MTQAVTTQVKSESALFTNDSTTTPGDSIEYPQLSSARSHNNIKINENRKNNNIGPSDESILSLILPVSNASVTEQAILHNISLLTQGCDFERNTKTGYLIWFFLGLFGIHHLYLRRYSHFFWCAMYLWTFGQMTYAPRVIAGAFGFYFILWIIDGFRLKTLIKIANMPYDIRYHQWSLYDIYLFWLPPYGVFGLHHFYMRNYWVGVAYLFSMGLIGFGWIFDLFLICCYYWPEIQSSLNRVDTNVDNNQTESILSDKDPKWCSKYRIKRNFCTILMTWCPAGGWIGLPYFYAGDVLVGICRFLTFNAWGVGWILDLFRLKSIINNYNHSIDEQIEQWHAKHQINHIAINPNNENIAKNAKNEANNANNANSSEKLEIEEAGAAASSSSQQLMANSENDQKNSENSDLARLNSRSEGHILTPQSQRDPNLSDNPSNRSNMSNMSNNGVNVSNNRMSKDRNNRNDRNDRNDTDNNDNSNEELRVERKFLFKKTVYDAYIIWFGSVGILGLHHLYLQNYVIFIGHILTCGGCGVMWVVDLFLLPWFVTTSNKKLGFVTQDTIANDKKQKRKQEKEVTLDDMVSDINNQTTKGSIISPKRFGHAIMARLSLDAQFGSDNSSAEEAVTPRNEVNNVNNGSLENNASNNSNGSNGSNGTNETRSDDLGRSATHDKSDKSDKSGSIDNVNGDMYDERLEFERKLYTAYLFWMPMMGFIGVYYLYLGRYKTFLLRFFTLNFLLIGWVIDGFQIYWLVKEYFNKKQRNEHEHSLMLNNHSPSN